MGNEMVFKFLLRPKILQLYYCISRFHYQVDSWLLLWGRDDGLCTLPISSVSQLVPFKNKRWLKCGKVCIAVSICVNKGMERTHTHTYTYIEYSWRYKPETNAGCFGARGLRDQDSEVGEGKLFFSVSCPLYVYPAFPWLSPPATLALLFLQFTKHAPDSRPLPSPFRCLEYSSSTVLTFTPFLHLGQCLNVTLAQGLPWLRCM